MVRETAHSLTIGGYNEAKVSDNAWDRLRLLRHRTPLTKDRVPALHGPGRRPWNGSGQRQVVAGSPAVGGGEAWCVVTRNIATAPARLTANSA